MIQQAGMVGLVTAGTDYVLVMISPVTYGTLSPQIRCGVAAAAGVVAVSYFTGMP